MIALEPLQKKILHSMYIKILVASTVQCAISKLVIKSEIIVCSPTLYLTWYINTDAYYHYFTKRYIKNKLTELNQINDMLSQGHARKEKKAQERHTRTWLL